MDGHARLPTAWPRVHEVELVQGDDDGPSASSARTDVQRFDTSMKSFRGPKSCMGGTFRRALARGYVPHPRRRVPPVPARW